MEVTVQAYREGDHASLVPSGPFDLAHAATAAQTIESVEASLDGCCSVAVDLAHIDRIDGAGAVLLARLLDRLDADGRHASVVESSNHEAARLIALYRERRSNREMPQQIRARRPLARIGALTALLPGRAHEALDFIGRFAVALPKAAAAPSSVDWRSFPRLIQEFGTDALPVTSGADFLIGVILGFVGVAQLARFGQVALVPNLVVVTHFRELGPLVTALVVAGRSGAGLASEIATMKVSEEIDALRSMSFDPVRWLVVPRCLALVATLPFLTWIGDALGLVGGLLAVVLITNMPAHQYIQATMDSITARDFLAGLVKTPFLALSIGLIACGQGLLTRGGAAAVGTRTTAAVVLAIFSVIVISVLFTFFYALMGI
jgi:phospholipid/cholesterol/gamma-HCH transport system permease protein